MTIDIDRLLSESAPEVAAHPGVGPAMAATARSVINGEGARPAKVGRRRTRTVVATGLAALCLGGTGVAAAAVFGAHTGWFTPSGSESDTSEWIDTRAADFPQVATELAPSDLPLPSGVTVADATAQVVRQSQANPGLQQETGIKATYVFYAQCQWKRAFLAAEVTPQAASSGLKSLANSAEFRAVDGGGLRANELKIADSLGGTVVPVALKQDFAANCKGGLGDAPKAVQ